MVEDVVMFHVEHCSTKSSYLQYVVHTKWLQDSVVWDERLQQHTSESP